MKKLLSIGLLVLLISVLVACGSVKGESSGGSPSIGKGKKIDMIDVTSKNLTEALAELQKAGFTNIKSNADSDPEWEESRWVVTEQSVVAGTSFNANEELALTCKKNCRVYLDITSEANLLFNMYDMDVYVGKDKAGTVANGEVLTKQMELLEGEYELIAYKASDNSVKATQNITVAGDMTVKCEIAHGGSINFKNTTISEGIIGASLKVADVTGKILSDAKEELESLGFVNVQEEPRGDIWDRNNWIVTSQSIKAGTEVDKNEKIQLDCIKLDKYLADTYVGKTLAEAESAAKESRFALRYLSSEDDTDLSEKVNALDDEHKAYWSVDSAKRSYDEEYTIKLYLIYEGTPEEKAAAKARAESAAAAKAEAEAKAKAEAEAKAKAEAEAKAKAEAEAEAAKKAEEERLQALENYLPKKMATKVLLVAFTNCQASDVFTDDGNYYDPSKFHDITYDGEFRQEVWKEGKWSLKDEKTWHVDTIYLKKKGYDGLTKVICDISFDGETFTLSGVKYLTATEKYIDSDDLSRTSGWYEEEPGEWHPYLTVPKEMVGG